MKYKAGYKYQLTTLERFETPFRPDRFVQTSFLLLNPDGTLSVLPGYAWDGPSGPTVDTKDFMRGSLAHDALYQLIRNGYLKAEDRKAADRILYRICREDGMPWLRAQWVYQGVRFGGKPAADPKNKKKEESAP